MKAAATLFTLLAPLLAAAQSLTAYVNPFIGTDGTGHVFPGATRPFGMVAPSPDNNDRGWSYASGYQYRAKTIMGFSNTHISGAGIGELGDVLLQPRMGRAWDSISTRFETGYAKRSESAQPGYYTVRLPAHGVKVELTATQRVALQRYRFDKAGTAQVLADLQHGILFQTDARVTHSDVKVDAAKGEISGTVHSRNWVEREASFVVQFSAPIQRVITLPSRPKDKAPRYVLNFDLGSDRTLQARVALSTVDVDGARRNLEEVQAMSFDEVHGEAAAQWEDMLGRIRIEAPERQKRIFYSALYRTLMHPSDIADVDGRVRGPTGQVQLAPGGHYYSTMSLWDTFRAVQPLFTLIVPERVDSMVATLIEHHKAQGYLPLWTAWGRETHTMIGNPALPVIADALAKGFKGFDAQAALRAMVETSTLPRPDAPAWAQRSWASYEQYGYLPFDKEPGEAVSKTLEYGVGDAAVAQVAAQLGDSATELRFAERAQGYRKLWDEGTRQMRGRDSQGNWRTPFDPLTATSPLGNPGDYTEANAWQYSLTPGLHDPQGLAQLMGGPAAFGRWLDEFFSVKQRGVDKHQGQEALIGQYAHGNEPSHHIAYLYAYTPQPWKGHALIQRISRAFYADSPAGITGNDDCGQMSAWYVFSTLGLYPVRAASGSYVLGSPQVALAQLRLADGKTLRVVAGGFAESRPYAAQAWLNGRAVAATQMDHTALTQGGELRFEMRPLPRR
ncbi:MAG: glycoside hydrolase family 92 protein [Burkholderiales bacterium]|nr:glycoside hydrolase family 92 protein [Burkholderiales bacterium]